MERSLIETLSHFESHLAGKAFIVYDGESKLFVFSFQLSDFMHLSGIQHIVKGVANARSMRGLNGVAGISNGSLTRDVLQSINGAQYLRNKARIDLLSEFDENFFSNPSLRLYEYDPARSPRKTLLPQGYVFLSPNGNHAIFFEVKKGRNDYIPASLFLCKPSIVDGQVEIQNFMVVKAS